MILTVCQSLLAWLRFSKMHFSSQTVLFESQGKSVFVHLETRLRVWVYLGQCVTMPHGQLGAVSQRFRITNHRDFCAFCASEA